MADIRVVVKKIHFPAVINQNKLLKIKIFLLKAAYQLAAFKSQQIVSFFIRKRLIRRVAYCYSNDDN